MPPRRLYPWTVVLSLAAACDGGGERAAQGAWMRDATAASGVDLVTTSGRTPSTQLLEVKGGGVALLDLEGDGDPDLFVANGATLDAPARGPGARLFRNESEPGGGPRFADVTVETGLDFRRWGFGTCVGDFDGDGRDDVYVACFGPNALLRNVGGGLQPVPGAAGAAGADVWSAAAACGDLDGDGDLDLYVANYVELDPAAPPPGTSFLGAPVFGGPMGLAGVADALFENLGDGTFRDVTHASGVGAAPASYGLGVAILDLDGDGLQDVLVGNDSQANFLFRNLGDLRFEEVGRASGLAYDAGGNGQATMGIALGDVDGDGRPDVFTTNFMNDANTLHVNRSEPGAPRFEDHTRRWGLAGPSQPFLGWSCAFADLDQDADEDLLIVNGHTYPREITEPRGWRHAQEPLLFERGPERFERVDARRGGAWLSAAASYRGAALGDLDGDGDLDVVTSELNGPLRVLENVGARGASLVVELRDPGSGNPRGLGAVVELVCGPLVQRRWIASGVGYQSCSEPVAHFGLGPAAGPCTVRVRWPDGSRSERAGVAPGARLRVERERAAGVER